MNDIEGIRLLRNLRKLTSQPRSNTMIFGEVVSVDPLKIDIGNNVVLTKEFLYLGQMCRPHKVTIPHTHKYNGVTEYSETGITATTTATPGTSPTPGTVTIIEPVSEKGTGHTHDIKDQETDNVHEEDCGTDYEDYVTLEIYPKLKGRQGDQPGDIVLMFAMNDNQMYYVAERIET